MRCCSYWIRKPLTEARSSANRERTWIFGSVLNTDSAPRQAGLFRASRLFNQSFTGWHLERIPWFRPAILLISFLIILPIHSARAEANFDRIRQQGLEAFEQARYTEARDYFQRAYELQPYNDDVRFRLALSLIYQDPDAPREPAPEFGTQGSYQEDLKRAVQLLRESVEVQERIEVRSPATGLRHFHLGVAYWFAGRPDLALDSFRRSFRSDFTRTDALYNRIVILKQMGKEKEAIVARQEYLRITRIEDLDD